MHIRSWSCTCTSNEICVAFPAAEIDQVHAPIKVCVREYSKEEPTCTCISPAELPRNQPRGIIKCMSNQGLVRASLMRQCVGFAAAEIDQLRVVCLRAC